MENNYTVNKNDWETPDIVFDPLNDEFNFVLDACANVDNSKCDLWLSEKTDALTGS